MRPAKPTRRALLSGTLASCSHRGVHISSAIVSVVPGRREEVTRRLCSLEGVEIHHRESFKIVIVIEADDAGTVGDRLAEITTWNGVLSANMVFEQAEDDGDVT
jgi:periplasmic nitrate reductase NapD